MGITFSDSSYWPAPPRVLRLLFEGIIQLPPCTQTLFENELKDTLAAHLNSGVSEWNVGAFEPYQLEISQELVSQILSSGKEPEESPFSTYLEQLHQLIAQEIPLRITNATWNKIEGWRTTGIPEKKQLEVWAFSENGFFLEQDEDLLLSHPRCILPLFELLGMKWSRRDTDIHKILLNYYHYTLNKRRDKNVLSIFDQLLQSSQPNPKQAKLIQKLTQMN